MTAPAKTLLSLDGLTVGHGRQPVLEDLSLRFAAGTFTGLLGANGSGKTTLLKTMLGILKPLAGRIEFTPVDGREPVLGYAPQHESLDPIYLLSSFEVVLMGVCGRVKPGRFISQSERDWARHCLERTGAGELSRLQFSELSGGQKQRVLIARALAAKPDFLLLDEPTAGIDASVKQSILDLLRQLHEEQRHTILMASHDLPAVRQYAQRAIWLRQGKALEGPAAELLAPESVEAILDLETH